MVALSQYYPTKIDWGTTIQDVVWILDTDTYRVTIQPYDINEPGAMNADKEVGFYIEDFAGERWKIVEINVDGSWDNVIIKDIFELGHGPQGERPARVYRSVGTGVSESIAPIKHIDLDHSALDNARVVDLEILWRNQGDIGRLTNLISYTVTVLFKNFYSEIPIGRNNLKVFKQDVDVFEDSGILKDQDVLFSNLVVTVSGFTFEIDPIETLAGIIVEYNFKQAT
jgi:hypothetical protein